MTNVSGQTGPKHRCLPANNHQEKLQKSSHETAEFHRKVAETTEIPTHTHTHTLAQNQSMQETNLEELIFLREYHSGQNDYIHTFLFWAVISEYVKIALHKKSGGLIFEYVKNSFTDKHCFRSEFLQIFTDSAGTMVCVCVCLYAHVGNVASEEENPVKVERFLAQ